MRALLLLAFALVACTSPATPSSTNRSTLADVSCAPLETVLHVDDPGVRFDAGGKTYLVPTVHIPAIATGDGDLYFAREDGADPAGQGLYVLTGGTGTPRKVAPLAKDIFVSPRMWVDGGTILIASYGRLYAVPAAGGEARLVSRVEDETHNRLFGQSALDREYVYILATYEASYDEDRGENLAHAA